MDTVLRSMQTGTPQSSARRSHPLRVRMGMVMTMAKVIEFYTPNKFRKQSGKWMSPAQRGKIIPFPVPGRNQHHVKKQRLVPASKIGWFGGLVGNSKEQISSNVNLL